MKRTAFSRTLSFLVTASLATASAFPGHALAADEGRLRGEVELGLEILDLDGRSYKYGEYSGTDRDGTYFIGGADIRYSRGDRYYLDLKADRMGQENRSIRLDTGIYGGYRLTLGHNETPHLISNFSSTPFFGAGTSRLVLPTGFATSATTSGMTSLSSSLKDVKLETHRKTSTMRLSVPLGNGLNFKVGVSHEDRDGTRSLGGPLGIHGGFTSSVVLPEPVDYTTNELTASLAYDGKKAHAEFRYHLSVFDNHEEQLVWDVPFLKYGPPPPVSPTYPTAARTSLPPGNRYQNFSLSGGVNLGSSARVSAVAEYGIMEQDSDLLPYTINPASTVNTPLPRTSAEAEINVKHVEVNLWTRALRGLDLNTRYRYYETDNRTPSDLFLRVINDTGNQSAVTDSSAAYNLPYDLKQNRINVDASYRIAASTTLKIGYEFDAVRRSYRESDKTEEDTWSARLSTRPVSYAALDLTYTRGDRKGDGYQPSDVFYARHS